MSVTEKLRAVATGFAVAPRVASVVVTVAIPGLALSAALLALEGAIAAERRLRHLARRFQ